MRRALVVFVAAKAVAVTALLAGRTFYFTPLHPWNYLVYTDQEAGRWLAFINWDAQHYLKLAIGGYPVPADPSSAFYPLFPALIALGMQLAMNPIVSGLVIVTAASALAFVLLTRITQDQRTLLLFASFPAAFYLSVVYSEALFIALLLGLFWALRDPNRAAAALVCAALLPLTRGQGLWLALPLILAWVVPGRLPRRALAYATIGYAIGVAAYLGFFAWRYGDALAGLKAQQAFVFKNALANLFDLPRFVGYLFTPPGRFLDTTNSGLDKLMIVVSLAALAYGIRRSPDIFFGAAWACFAILPAMMGEGGSYARHALIAWTCFAIAAGPALRPALAGILIAGGLALQVYLAYAFGANRWVG